MSAQSPVCPKADIDPRSCDVAQVPTTDLGAHLINSSARRASLAARSSHRRGWRPLNLVLAALRRLGGGMLVARVRYPRQPLLQVAAMMRQRARRRSGGARRG